MTPYFAKTETHFVAQVLKNHNVLFGIHIGRDHEVRVTTIVAFGKEIFYNCKEA